MEIRKGKLLYSGKIKRIYATNIEDRLILSFKDEACFYDNGEIDLIKTKSKNAASVSATLFRLLENYHIPTHFIQPLKANELIVQKLEMIPLYVVFWNYASSHFAKRYGLEKGKPLDYPVIEFYWKNPKYHNPMLFSDHAVSFSLAKEPEIMEIISISRKTNAVLKSFFERRNLVLADFRLKFGRSERGLLIGDEISPDTCRLWDSKNGTLDMNHFRLDRGNLQTTYDELFERIGIQP